MPPELSYYTKFQRYTITKDLTGAKERSLETVLTACPYKLRYTTHSSNAMEINEWSMTVGISRPRNRCVYVQDELNMRNPRVMNKPLLSLFQLIPPHTTEQISQTRFSPSASSVQIFHFSPFIRLADFFRCVTPAEFIIRILGFL